MTTALDEIKLALKSIGQLAAGETPAAEDTADALEVFNEMLDAMSTERLMIYSTQDQTFTWATGAASKTIGPTGDFVGNRPASVDRKTYFKDASGYSYPLTIIGEEEYNEISDKTSGSSYPEYLFVNMTMPDVTLTVYPVPSSETYWHIVSLVELSQPAGLATTLSFPPGYKKMFRTNLAVELAAFFGVEASPTTQRMAVASKKNIKRMNKVSTRMQLPSCLPVCGASSNILTGN